MTNLNTFESVFKSADKPAYTFGQIEVSRVVVVTDLSDAEATPMLARLRTFLSVLGDNLVWRHLGGTEYANVGDLLERVEQEAPDLVVTYRHLQSNAWHWPHGLGEYLDVLSHVTKVPILILPHPEADNALPHTMSDTDTVMAITNHLTADARLVDYALQFTAPSGTCWLTHIESQRQFDHFVSAVEKISEIETDDVRLLVEEQLLKEPRDYIESCRREIEARGVSVVIEAIVEMGDRVADYRRLIEDHRCDLLVLNTWEGGQPGMQGQSYLLAVELRNIPLLLL
jgi:hypothetical protein